MKIKAKPTTVYMTELSDEADVHICTLVTGKFISTEEYRAIAKLVTPANDSAEVLEIAKKFVESRKKHFIWGINQWIQDMEH